MPRPALKDPPPKDSFQVGWICALPEELAAAASVLDEEYNPLPEGLDGDDNIYTLGRIGNHHVVIACLPDGIYGLVSAATVAKDMGHTFSGSLRFGFMIGIAAGIPSNPNAKNMRLGDVVVSTLTNDPKYKCNGVVQYDSGKLLDDGELHLTGTANAPPKRISTAVAVLKSTHMRWEPEFPAFIEKALRSSELFRKNFHRPDRTTDRLFKSEFPHPRQIEKSCKDCPPEWEEERDEEQRQPNMPKVFYGIIASGNSLVRNSERRDQIGFATGAMCIEMEAAGLVQGFPCIIIRGICDYADSHKNDVWHNYAALSAAAYAKELLLKIPCRDVEAIKPAVEVCNELLLDIANGQIEHHRQAEEHQQQSNLLMVERQRQADEHHRQDSFLQARGQQQASEHHQEMSQLQKQQQEQTQLHYDEKQRQAQTKDELKCIRKFKTCDYESFKNRNEDPEPQTCQWVLKHPFYLDWLKKEDRKVLLISADPGCGKSVLAKSLVDKEIMNSMSESSRSIPLICHFFFKDNSNQDTLSTALCAIIHQLLIAAPACSLPRVMEKWRKEKAYLQLDVESLWTLILSISGDANAPQIISIFDALDECRGEDQPRFIRKLSQLQNDASSRNSKFKICVTSRPYDDLHKMWRSNIPDLRDIQLSGEDKNDELRKEIDIVIESRMAKLGLNDDLRQRLTMQLKRFENRTYLWVHLCIQDIAETYDKNFKPDKQQLDLVPVSVFDAYEKMLERASRRNCRRQKCSFRCDTDQCYLIKKVLQIIVGAHRPLTIEEMSVALGLVLEPRSESLSAAQLKIEGLAVKLRNLAGLFIYLNDSKIYLFHQTAKTYLLGAYEGPVSPWHFNTAEADELLAFICLKTLLLPYSNHRQGPEVALNEEYQRQRNIPWPGVKPRGSLIGSCELFQYSARHWADHYKLEPAIDSIAIADVSDLSDPTSSLFFPWYVVF